MVPSAVVSALITKVTQSRPLSIRVVAAPTAVFITASIVERFSLSVSACSPADDASVEALGWVRGDDGPGWTQSSSRVCFTGAGISITKLD